ncbi:MAG: T9SS type A sorting domain-containing protein [Bacteroidota bacterium]
MKNLLFSFFLLIQFCAVKNGFSQNYYERYYNLGVVSDEGRDMIQLQDSGFALIGRTYNTPGGDADIWLVRTNQNGDTLWTKRYGGTGGEWAYSIDTCAGGGFVIAGNTTSYGSGTPSTSNWYFIRTNQNGDTLLTKVYGNTQNDRLYHAIQTNDGGYILCGWIGSGGAIGYMRKLDIAGNTVWTASYGGGINYAVEEPSGDIVVSGSVFSSTWDLSIRRYTSAGVFVTGKVYHSGATWGDGGPFLKATPDGGYIIGGISGYLGSMDPWIVKTDANLDSTWARKIYSLFTGVYDWTSRDFSIYPVQNGYILGGTYLSQLKIVKLNMNGTTAWTQSFGGSSSSEYGYTAIPTLGGGLAAVGFSNFIGGGGNYDYYLVKTDSAGCTGPPQQPGSISGSTSLCANANTTYSITAVPNATSYIWSLPSGWTGTSTTNSINITIDTNPGTVSVSAVSSCGVSLPQTLSVSIQTAPVTPSAISGDTSYCENSGNMVFSIPSDPNATGYTWTLPTNWVGTSATNTISATPIFNSGTVAVTANNACGNSSPQTLFVTYHALPAITYFQDPDVICDVVDSLLLDDATPAGGTYSGTGVSNGYFHPPVAGTGMHVIFYNYTDQFGCSNMDTESITVTTCTVVEENEKEEMIVYPNPASGFLYIVPFSSVYSVRVYDPCGKLAGIYTNATVIEISNLSPGMYVLELEDENSIRREKVLVY